MQDASVTHTAYRHGSRWLYLTWKCLRCCLVLQEKGMQESNRKWNFNSCHTTECSRTWNISPHWIRSRDSRCLWSRHASPKGCVRKAEVYEIHEIPTWSNAKAHDVDKDEYNRAVWYPGERILWWETKSKLNLKLKFYSSSSLRNRVNLHCCLVSPTFVPSAPTHFTGR